MAVSSKAFRKAAAAAYCATVFLSSSAAADLIIDSGSAYFVRPYLTTGINVQDGLRQNGPVTATQSQGVQGYSESTVDLRTGTVKMYTESYDGLVTLTSAGVFGERLTFRGGAGTSWNLNFSIEGSIFTQGGGPILDHVGSPFWYYDVGLVVHRPGQANWSNFNSVANQAEAVLHRWEWRQGPANYVDEYDVVLADLMVSGDIPLASNNEVFDIFAYANVWVLTSPGDGLEAFTADFMNTATFGQTVAPGVDVFSSSGEFLGLQSPTPSVSQVPTPATLSLLGLGLLALGFSRRQKSA